MRFCLDCTTVYADAPACPHCGSTEGDDMAKISRHGGATELRPDGVDVPEYVPAEPEPEPDDEPELLAEVVPDGTVDVVIAWTEDDPEPPARLLSALDAERARPTPRVTLTGELERRLAQF